MHLTIENIIVFLEDVIISHSVILNITSLNFGIKIY